MAGVLWNNTGSNSTVDIQPGGPGNPWLVFDQDAALDAPSGGGRPRATLWGRAGKGGLQPRGLVYTGNPPDFSANLSYRYSSENALKRLNCPFNVRARQYCGSDRTNMTGFVSPGMKGLLQATVTKFGFDSGLAMMDGAGKDVNRTAAIAASLEETWVDVAHDDISGTTNDVAFKRVISIGAEVCYGACGLAATEEDAWLAVTVKDSSPTYGGTSAPWLYWTTNAWGARNAVRIGPYLGADALDVVLAGSRVIVFSDTKAPVYASLSNVYNGVVDPLLWTTASGISETGTNFPRAAVAVDSNTILAVGSGGRIWQSTDGGSSFTKIYDTGTLTSANLVAIDAQSQGNAFAVGASGTFIRLIKTPGQNTYTGSLVTVKDANANVLSSNILSVRTPPTRGNEVYVGTAGGEIWRTRNATDTVVVFENKPFDKSGTGSVADLYFVGYQGNVLYVLQSAADSTSRILRDFSGGNLGTDVKIVGDFVAPGNFGMTSMAFANVNMGITVGNVHGSYAYIGKVRPA